MIILKILNIPPPYGGVTVFNQRFYDLIKKKEVPANFFSSRLSDCCHGVEYIDTSYLSIIKVLLASCSKVWSFRCHLVGKIGVTPHWKDVLKQFGVSLILSRKLEKSDTYSVLCDHISPQIMIYEGLKFLDFKCQISVYLHGAGLIEGYNNAPAYIFGLSLIADDYMVASEYMGDLAKKRLAHRPINKFPCFLPDNYLLEKYLSVTKQQKALFIGALEDHKNPLYFLNEINITKKFKHCYEVYFIGEGSQLDAVKENILLARLENVHLLGRQNCIEISQLLEDAELLIMPSKREPFGIVVTEAMAKGTIPIVSDKGGMKEIFSEEAGFVFPLESGRLAELLDSLDGVDIAAMSRKSLKESSYYTESVVGLALVHHLLRR